jgi:hypothetical protein
VLVSAPWGPLPLGTIVVAESSWCVTHDPKRKKVAFDAIVAVVPRYSLSGFRAGVAATWRAMPNDNDDAFKLVVFKISNADFDLAAWVRVRDFDLTGDAVK